MDPTARGDLGVDVVIDAVGRRRPLDFTCVQRRRIVLCGVMTGAGGDELRTVLIVNVLGSTLGSMEDFRQVLNAAGVNKLRPVIDEVFPLNRARDAMAKMEAGRQFGKIILRIAQ
jgi:NADPH:quinone reductase-like Zn-dependent oxidoreductase